MINLLTTNTNILGGNKNYNDYLDYNGLIMMKKKSIGIYIFIY